MLFDSAPDLAAIELRLRQLLPGRSGEYGGTVSGAGNSVPNFNNGAGSGGDRSPVGLCKPLGKIAFKGKVPTAIFALQSRLED
ncbi:MAG: hypothetical protein HC879_04625 [Leptolyngbyaceae cyanobacterium SL_5_9]|nr:hypothetical protein [Leptolyngbyaceae cyanobacterium SL_5_9]